MVNPFDDHKIAALDPFSCDFDAEEWAKHFFHTIGSDPERYPQRTAGVSYRDVAVFGFGSDTDYQKDVVNVMYHAVNVIKESFRPKRRVPILTEFDGLRGYWIFLHGTKSPHTFSCSCLCKKISDPPKSLSEKLRLKNPSLRL